MYSKIADPTATTELLIHAHPTQGYQAFNSGGCIRGDSHKFSGRINLYGHMVPSATKTKQWQTSVCLLKDPTSCFEVVRAWRTKLSSNARGSRGWTMKKMIKRMVLKTGSWTPYARPPTGIDIEKRLACTTSRVVAIFLEVVPSWFVGAVESLRPVGREGRKVTRPKLLVY